jgi:hypothetical protein
MVVRLLGLLLVSVAAAAVVAGRPPTGAAAAPVRFKVKTTFDAHNVDVDNGKTCLSTAAGQACSVRAAVEAANNLTAADASSVVIKLKKGHYVLSQGELGFTNKEIAVSVAGKGAHKTTLDGNTNHRVIDVCDGTLQVNIRNLTIQYGRVPQSTCPNLHRHGAGIHNHGSMSVVGVRLFSNTAPDGFESGGGITNAGPGVMFLGSSSLLANAADLGGAIENFGFLQVANTTISGNTASVEGAGIYNRAGAILELTNATITNNTVGSGFSGGVESKDGGTVDAANTIIIKNKKTGQAAQNFNCIGPIDSDGSNMEDSDLDFACFSGSDVRTANPGLGPLLVNPGRNKTDTHALLEGSPAIDAGNNSSCVPGSPSRDQRGRKRKDIGGVGDNGVFCDIGAYEFP